MCERGRLWTTQDEKKYQKKMEYWAMFIAKKLKRKLYLISTQNFLFSTKSTEMPMTSLLSSCWNHFRDWSGNYNTFVRHTQNYRTLAQQASPDARNAHFLELKARHIRNTANNPVYRYRYPLIAGILTITTTAFTVLAGLYSQKDENDNWLYEAFSLEGAALIVGLSSAGSLTLYAAGKCFRYYGKRHPQSSVNEIPVLTA